MLNKMLRATLTKIKKVCIESFTPRIFRGDFYIPGKFQKFSATTLTRAHKSTDSGKGSKEDDEHCKKLIDEIFNNKAEKFLDPTTDLNNVRELKREDVSQIYSPHVVTPETQCQVCEKLIAQAFGKDGDDKLPNDASVSATTAKQTEEQLAQKVETIDETPLVEAAKPKIEGFNVNPKVLGGEENIRLETLHFDKYEGKDGDPCTENRDKANNDLEKLCQKVEKGNRFYHAGKDLYKMPEFNPYENRNPVDPTYTGMTYVNHPYDDIAKRCINIPPNKMDEHILKELQRLGVPHSGGYASNTDNTDNVDDVNKQINNFNLQTGNHGDSPPDNQALTPNENEKLKDKPMIYEQDKRPMPLCMMEKHVVDDTIMTLAAIGPKPKFNPNRMLLDPFDKKSLCHDCVDPEYDVLSCDKVHILVQKLENKNFIEQNVQEQQTESLPTNETNYVQQSEYQTQSTEKTQSHVKPEYKNYEIKPLHESPRLPVRPVNLCNENYTIHPANREPHYSMDQFRDSEKRHNQMNYQENMVFKQHHQHENQQHQEHNYYVNTPINNQNQQYNFWNRGYQNGTNYYGNGFQSGAENYPTTPEGPPKVDLPHGQQSYMHSASVHVFTNAATSKPETPDTVETVLLHNANITPEEVAEHIKQQTTEQARNISDENNKPGNAEEPRISQQTHFGEQIPAQQVQFYQPEQQPDTDQECLRRPIDPVHLSVKDQYDPFDLRRYPIEQTKTHVTIKANQEQPDIKEQTQTIEQVKILGSVKVHSEQFDKKEQPIEQTQILRSVRAHPEQLDKKAQPIEHAQILGTIKINPEQLDKKDQPSVQAQILDSSVKVPSEQLAKKEQPIEQPQILGSVKAHPEQIDKNEQAQILESVKTHLEPQERPIEHLKVLTATKAEEDQDLRKQSIEQLKILRSVQTHPEQLDKKEQPTKQAQTLGSLNNSREQNDLKEQKQTIVQLQVLRSVKAQLEPPERPIEHLKVLTTQEDQHDFRKQPIEQPKELGANVLSSVKADQEQAMDNKEGSVEHAKLIKSVNARQERLDLKRQAIDQLKILESANSHREKLENKEQAMEHIKLLSSVKPQKMDDVKEQTIDQPKILGSLNIQAPKEKTESIHSKPKPEDPNDEFKRKLSSTILPIPKLNDEKLPLSVLLKRLRERSKIETCHDLIEPVGRKCGDYSPPCPPPAPTCPPPKPCPPPPCPPPPSPCPKPCKPACPNPCGPPKSTCPPKNPCSKYVQIDTDFAAILRETDVYLKKRMYETVTAILTKEVIVQLEKMGVSLLIAYPNEVRDLDNVEDVEVAVENTNNEACQVNASGIDLVKDYEPWVPIPSWPIPRKVKKRPLVCPKDGCKIIPPPKLSPPCNQNPCIGFPKRKKSFSTPDSSDLPENVSIRYGN